MTFFLSIFKSQKKDGKEPKNQKDQIDQKDRNDLRKDQKDPREQPQQRMLSRMQSPSSKVHSSNPKINNLNKKFESVRRHYTGNPTQKELDPYKLKNGPTLGMGSFGRVYIGYYDQDVYAVKRLRKKHVIDSRQCDHVASEVNSLSVLPHPFIVGYVDRFMDEKYLYIIMEYVPGGEFFSYLRNQAYLTEENCRFYGAQVAMIFDYLNLRGYCYRDLKPENILIGPDGYIKLGDFGFTKQLGNGRTYTVCGTPEYLAPEVINKRGYAYSVDWWTLGILLYEMAYGSPPYTGDSPYEIYEKILSKRIAFPRRMTLQCRDLLRLLLRHDPETRCGTLNGGSLDVLFHPWFNLRSFKFQDIIKKQHEAPYYPMLKSTRDTSNFDKYRESTNSAIAVNIDNNPAAEMFSDWRVI